MNELDLEISRRCAWDFCQEMLPEFYENRQFLHVVADTYQYLIEQDDTPQYIIDRIQNSSYVEKFNHNPQDAEASYPPRAGKSITVTLCSAWALGNYTEESILRVTHSQKLFNKFSRNLREFVRSPIYQLIFPHVELSRDNTEVAGWSFTLSKQFAFFGSGVGGGITGDGASLIAITDDLYKSHIEANSPSTNETTLEFMESAFNSRKEKDCVQFDIGTRWSKEDYMGNKLDNDEYDIIIRVPALDDNDETFCEDVKSTIKYQNLRKKMIRDGREHIWDAEYQQEPIDIKGILFPEQEMKRFSLKDLNMENCIGKINFVDTADEGTDFYSSPVGYIFPRDNTYDVYIARVLFTKDSFKYTQPIQIEMVNSEEITYTFIETNKEGSLYVMNIKNACPNFKVKGLRNKGNKETRILMEAGYVLDFYFLIDKEQNDQYKAYFTNLCKYKKEGKNETDDAADSTAGLSYVTRKLFKILSNNKEDDTDSQTEQESENL